VRDISRFVMALDGHLERSLAVARHGCSQCSGSDNSIVPVDLYLVGGERVVQNIGGVIFSEVGGLGCVNHLTPVGHVW